MWPTIKETLADVTFKVLETMFFVLPEPFDPNKSHSGPWDLKATLELKGDRSLILHLFLPRDLALNLASNFLGKEPPEISKEELLDLMKELANMIGGNLVAKLDSSTELMVGIPQSGLVGPGDSLPHNQEQKILVQIDNHFMMLAWD